MRSIEPSSLLFLTATDVRKIKDGPVISIIDLSDILNIVSNFSVSLNTMQIQNLILLN